MIKPALPILSRARPTKTYKKYLKYAWRPPPTEEQTAWGVAATTYLRHLANLRPDAFAPLSDLITSQVVPEVEPGQILEWVKNDQLQRFELVTDLERSEGQPGWHKTTYIRVREGHSIPDVSISTTRLRVPGHIRSLIYATAPENWSFIERKGLRPDLAVPQLPKPKPLNPNFIYFPQHLTTLSPPTSPRSSPTFPLSDKPLVQLHIRLDVAAAMDAGIKFFTTTTKQIISTGLAGGGIPPAFFKDVFVVSLKREMLYDSGDTRPTTELEPSDSGWPGDKVTDFPGVCDGLSDASCQFTHIRMRQVKRTTR